jgi:Probable zinc-ribbon domain
MAKDRYQDFVEHPRYGRRPRKTGLEPRPEPSEHVFVHWHGGRISETAITADTSRQVPATVQVTHYFDCSRVCRGCERRFIFFAEEQRYWYEELRLPLEADAVRCVPCRRKVRELQVLNLRYQELCHSDLSEAEVYEMVEIGLVLVEEGLFQGKVLNKLKAMLRQLLKSSAYSERANALLSELHGPCC